MGGVRRARRRRGCGVCPRLYRSLLFCSTIGSVARWVGIWWWIGLVYDSDAGLVIVMLDWLVYGNNAGYMVMILDCLLSHELVKASQHNVPLIIACPPVVLASLGRRNHLR